jgi:hypothetical protein
LARLTCDLLFPTGSWTTATTASAALRLTQGGHTFAVGRRAIRGGGVAIRMRVLRRLSAGVYQLHVTVRTKKSKTRTYLRRVRLH